MPLRGRDKSPFLTCLLPVRSPFPVDIFNTTIRGDGGFNKLMLVIIEGTGLGIVGGDRLYLGQPFTAAAKAMTVRSGVSLPMDASLDVPLHRAWLRVVRTGLAEALWLIWPHNLHGLLEWVSRPTLQLAFR